MPNAHNAPKVDRPCRIIHICHVPSRPIPEDAMLEGTVSLWRRLTGNELQAFGIRGVSNDASEHRAWQRFPANLLATYRRAAPEYDEAVSAQVLDLSPSGVGLLSGDRVEAGQLINLELRCANRPN